MLDFITKFSTPPGFLNENHLTTSSKFQEFTVNMNNTNDPQFEYLKLCNFNSSLKTCLLVPVKIGKFNFRTVADFSCFKSGLIF